MCIIDDPVLALIARFVVEDIGNPGVSDEMYLQYQVAETSRYIENASGKQLQKLALAWIKGHAERYRQEWQRGACSKIVLNSATICPSRTTCERR